MEKENKKVKKIIVNGLTLSRVAGTIAMPVLFNTLSAPIFLLVVAAILFTDCLDGILARHWRVSTIFGSLLDMGADKLFGVAVLIVLSTMYPVMSIPLILETLIAGVNIKAAENNAIAKSSEIGRMKTGVIGASMCVLLLTGMSSELIECLHNIKIPDLSNTILSKIPALEDFILTIFKGMKKVEFDKNSKELVETFAKTAAITAESIVATDYTIKAIKGKDKSSNTYKIAELIKNKKFVEYTKKVLFDEKYYQETKDMPILEKLCPPELREEIKRKKLTPNK